MFLLLLIRKYLQQQIVQLSCHQQLDADIAVVKAFSIISSVVPTTTEKKIQQFPHQQQQLQHQKNLLKHPVIQYPLSTVLK